MHACQPKVQVHCFSLLKFVSVLCFIVFICYQQYSVFSLKWVIFLANDGSIHMRISFVQENVVFIGDYKRRVRRGSHRE